VDHAIELLCPTSTGSSATLTSPYSYPPTEPLLATTDADKRNVRSTLCAGQSLNDIFADRGLLRRHRPPAGDGPINATQRRAFDRRISTLYGLEDNGLALASTPSSLSASGVLTLRRLPGPIEASRPSRHRGQHQYAPSRLRADGHWSYSADTRSLRSSLFVAANRSRQLHRVSSFDGPAPSKVTAPSATNDVPVPVGVHLGAVKRRHWRAGCQTQHYLSAAAC